MTKPKNSTRQRTNMSCDGLFFTIHNFSARNTSRRAPMSSYGSDDAGAIKIRRSFLAEINKPESSDNRVFSPTNTAEGERTFQR
jgi:hypothetical protein